MTGADHNPKPSSYDQALWGGRFTDAPHKDAILFSTSIQVDWRLWRADIRGSIAHARMLGDCGIIEPSESNSIIDGLSAIGSEFDLLESKAQLLSTLLGRYPEAEDIHTVIELELKKKIGAVAGKLHTARSRNDQVALAFRLTLIDQTRALQAETKNLLSTLLRLARGELTTLMPGLTHMQHAQPVSLAHHLMAYFWMFNRDIERLQQWSNRTSVSPLGAAALAGTRFPIDRNQVANELELSGVIPNSLDAVGDRDFAFELASHLALISIHLSKLADELVLWSTPEFAFIELSDQMTTGSSIMPQKKNPDLAELIRGRSGRSIGALVQLATLMKGLPTSYHRDLQEDKEPIFYSLDSVRGGLRLMEQMLATAQFNRDRMADCLRGDFSNATDLADDLAESGVPFREAHDIAGKVVRYCLEKTLPLEEVTLAELQKIDQRFSEATLQKLGHLAVLRARKSQGGTAPEAVTLQMDLAEKALSDSKA